MNSENLLKFLPTDSGVFFEAGANDGIFQSYTYILESSFGWTGVLVEPSLSAFERCKLNRPNSLCLNLALTDDINTTEIWGDFDGHPMGSVDGRRLSRNPSVKVQATTLTDIFDTHFENIEVDLISIDVENYELSVLKGMDFNKHKPKYILIEIYSETFEQVDELLKKNGYELISCITGFSHQTHPNWDGTHNDYLYKLL